LISCSAGCGEARAAGDLLKALKRAEIMLMTSQSLYYGQKRTSDSKAMLDKLIAGGYCEGLALHPYHPILFQAHIDSINVSDALGTTQTSIQHCKQVLNCANAVLPPDCLETSNYYYYLGKLYAELAENQQKKTEDKEEQTNDAGANAARTEAFNRCYAMRSLWFGPQHPNAIKALQKP